MTTTTSTHETAAAADEDDDDYCEAGPLVVALPELWSRFAEYGDGLVCAFRLMSVCKAARVGMKTWLRTLPALVVCGGFVGIGGHAQEASRVSLVMLGKSLALRKSWSHPRTCHRRAIPRGSGGSCRTWVLSVLPARLAC